MCKKISECETKAQHAQSERHVMHVKSSIEYLDLANKCAQVCMQFVCMCVCVCVYMSVFLYIYICMCACVCARACACVRV